MRNNSAYSESVRVRVIESGGLYLATSADVPSLWATSFEPETLLEEIDQAIREHYWAMGADIRAIHGACAAKMGSIELQVLPYRREAAE